MNDSVFNELNSSPSLRNNNIHHYLIMKLGTPVHFASQKQGPAALIVCFFVYVCVVFLWPFNFCLFLFLFNMKSEAECTFSSTLGLWQQKYLDQPF